MPIQIPQPSKDQQLPSGFKPLICERFQGVNTSTLRAGVPDEQTYWLDGFMPLDNRNIRTLYGVGTTLYNAVSEGSTTVVFYKFANIGSTPYCIVFLANGRVIAVNANTSAVTTILAAATITSPSILNQDVSQWGREYVIIVSDQTNGYWLWNGSTTFTAGTLSPVVEITNNGSGYTANPTIVISGGHGTGASISGSINTQTGILATVSVVNPGSGYLATDVVTAQVVGGNAGGTGASLSVVSMVSFAANSWSVASVSIVAGGSGYSNTPSVTFNGGGSTGFIFVNAQGLVTSAGGVITSFSLTQPGYYNSSAKPTMSIVDSAVNASISIALMPFAIDGTSVETYQGRVWVAGGPTVYYTSPGRVDDFATTLGGGNFTSSDSFLKVSYTRLISANGFLYLIGDSSINYISNPNTEGSPPTTTFSNLNADPEVGSPFPASVQVFGRNIMFANSFGIHVCYGASVQKVSQMLDGVYNTVVDFGGVQISSAKATIFGRKVWMSLARIVDPVVGTTSNKLLMWDGAKKWWASDQDITLTYISSLEIDSELTAYGTNGTIIAPLFSTASSSLEKRLATKLWDDPGSYLFTKTNGRFWATAYYNSTVSVNLRLTIDNQAGAGATTYTITGATQTGYFLTPPQAVGQVGQFLGFTIKSNASDVQIVSAIIDADPHDYRG